MTRSRFLPGRRQALQLGTGALAMGAGILPARAQSLPVRVGWNPLAGGSAAIIMVMIRDKLFEAEAARMGKNIAIDWKTFTAGPPATEALATGQLDIDLHIGSLPSVNRIAANLPATPFGVVGSHISNAVMVPPNSAIKKPEDLAGKRIGLPVGTTAHYLVASIVKFHLDKSLQEAGIRIVNMPATDAVKVPTGVDAGAVWVPLRFMGPQLGISQMLVDGDGYLGKGSSQPGTQTEAVKKSWAYPEGYNTDRLYAFATNKFIDGQSDLLVAFLLAHLEAQKRVVANPEPIVDLVAERWQQDKLIARTTLQTYAETAGLRRAPFILEWDALTLVKASEFLRSIGARDKALTMADIKPLLEKTAAIQKKVWDAMPDKPSDADLVKGFSGKTELYGPIVVNGGEPVWKSAEANWAQRLYKPGPF